MAQFEHDRLRRVLAAELDRLIEEFRNLEDSASYEQLFGNHIELENSDYDFLVAITYEKGCSLAVAAAAMIEWRLLYPEYDVVLEVRTKN
jgi:hypothetical protein